MFLFFLLLLLIFDFFLFKLFFEFFEPFFMIVEYWELSFFGSMFGVLFGWDEADLFVDVDSTAEGSILRG